MVVNNQLVTDYLALIAYIATLLPSNSIAVFSSWKKADWRVFLLRNRRNIGLICFALSIIHGVLTLRVRNVDMLNINTYVNYFTGFSCILIFTILAVTSNNWSIRKLGKNWKKLHSLTYVALIVLILHLLVVNQGEWNWYTWCAFIALSSMTCMWLLRLLRRYR
ncbi:putative membrane protein [Rivularia sp. PCC 7116]|uniref:ferric reductase-like transmembrane domain-containing protein n=1 Tax=Rivularia sp. PCC 7116 TaxID=373994 RepID=UPI00029EFEBC|nr:ferric reductase-like transmembrane domain-containing protein [Rivularia sp. PCC 7116]AFY57264.1 putative membrane protein [Rivularia sp. PCC 7116]